MILNSFLKLFILLVLIIVDNQSFPLRIKGKKIIINSNVWASEWFQMNKNELILMTDQQLKFKLYQEIVKYYKIDQKIFNEILSKDLYYQKKQKKRFLEHINKKK
jgi:hypothetical protein